MAKEYLTVDGKLVMVNGELVQVPDAEQLNDIADENGALATQTDTLSDDIENLIVNGVIDGSPRDVYDNLTALQTAYPNGASGVYLTKDNGHWYYWNGTAWTDGGVYQSTEIVDTYEWTLTTGKYINRYNGNEQSLVSTSVVKIYLPKDTIIEYNYAISSPDSRGLAFFDENDIFIKGYQTLSTTQVITAPKNTYYMKATISYTSVISSVTDVIKIHTNKALANNTSLYLKLGVDLSSYFTITTNKYINPSGQYISVSGSNAVEFRVIEGMKITYKSTTPNPDFRGIAFLDNNLNVVQFYYMSTTSQDLVVPENAVICRASIWGTSSVSNDLDIDFSNVGNKLIENYNNEETSLLTTTDDPLELLTDDTGMLDIFLNVGCIGDSLSSGECASKSGGVVSFHDLYQYSWGQYLARKTGNTYYNWSRGGLTTGSWLSSSYATECYDGNHLCQAYIIGLGQNDYNQGVSVGSSSDIDLTDYHNNASTFYGNYAKIIQKIKEINPKSKIFVITDMKEQTETGGYNTAIRDMATIFDNVYLMDFYTYGIKYYQNVILNSQMRSGHYNAYGYKICAMMIANYINWILIKYYNEFKQVEFIGTNLSYE